MGVFICIAIFVILMSKEVKKAEIKRAKYESKLGHTFILRGDSLTIIDYSSFKHTFTLSNGTEVGERIVFKQDSLKQ